jgi:hypothetical protein
MTMDMARSSFNLRLLLSQHSPDERGVLRDDEPRGEGGQV